MALISDNNMLKKIYETIFLTYNNSLDLYESAEILFEKGNMDEYIFMLTSIKEFTEKGFTISRKTMASVAKDEFPKMTEERIRKKADDLQELGLITKSVGRIGMRLTLNGLKYVTMFNQLTPINTRIKPLS